MKTTTFATLALAATLTSSNAVVIRLAEFALNIDGSQVLYGIPPLGTGDAIPFGLNASGLGTLSVALTPGSHYLSLYVDHDIDEATNTFTNETGSASGGAASNQSWEIDEPGWTFGDIYTNFLGSALDNSVGTLLPEDVSMALGWNLVLQPSETATVFFTLSESPPNGGFYLAQIDPDSGGAVYFSSNVDITGSPPGVPDVGSTLTLLLCACGGLAGWRALFKFFP